MVDACGSPHSEVAGRHGFFGGGSPQSHQRLGGLWQRQENSTAWDHPNSPGSNLALNEADVYNGYMDPQWHPTSPVHSPAHCAQSSYSDHTYDLSLPPGNWDHSASFYYDGAQDEYQLRALPSAPILSTSPKSGSGAANAMRPQKSSHSKRHQQERLQQQQQQSHAYAGMPSLMQSSFMDGQDASIYAEEHRHPRRQWGQPRQQSSPGHLGDILKPSSSPMLEEEPRPSLQYESLVAALVQEEVTSPKSQPEVNRRCREDHSRYAGPYLIRNTFLDAPPERSPSLEPFYEERKLRSAPVSGPPSSGPWSHPPSGPPSRPPSGPPSGRRAYDVVNETGSGSSDPSGAIAVARRGGVAEDLSTASSALQCTDSSSAAGSTRPESLQSQPQLMNFHLDRDRAWEPASSSGSGEIPPSEPQELVARPERNYARPPRPQGANRGSQKDVLPVGGGSPDGHLPSRGSALHRWGACKPCAFVYQDGCKNDLECKFCHLCKPGERKRRKKERLQYKREVRDAARQVAAT